MQDRIICFFSELKEDILAMRNILPFLLSVTMGLMVHFVFYSQELLNPDGLWGAEHRLSNVWEVSLGRWAWYLLEPLRGGINSYSLSAFSTIILFSVGGLMLSKVFMVRNIFSAAVISVFITCSPFVAMVMTYPVFTFIYGLSFLLAVLAVYACFFSSKRILGMGVAIVCIVFSLATYQASLGVAFAAVAGYVLISLLKEPLEVKSLLKNAIITVATIIAGVLVYYVLMQMMLSLWDVSLSSFKGADRVGVGNTLQNITGSAGLAYSHFKAFFFDSWLARNAYGEIYLYSLLAIVAVVTIALRIFSLKVASSQRLLLAFYMMLILIMLPVFCNVINIAAPNAGLYLLMCSGMMVVVPLIIALTGWGEGLEKTQGLWTAQNILHKLSVLLACSLIWAFMLTNQTDAQVMQNTQQQTVQLANRIWERVEAYDGYVPGKTEILITGTPSTGNYPPISTLYEKANVYARWGLLWEDSYGNAGSWQQLYRRYLGIEYNMCTEERSAKIIAMPEYKQMPIYPEKGSLQTLDGVLVIKVSKIFD